MNISIISGSARANNNTIRVAKAIEKYIIELGHEVTLVDFISYDIPLINQGEILTDNLTSFQKHLVDSMTDANAIIIITPEYNWSTTPEILNWLHRFGERRFADLFNHKVFATVGVSTGKGGKAPALHLHSILNKIISFTDLDSVVAAKIYESHYTKEVLNENGTSQGNTQYDNGLNDFINYTLRITGKWVG
ncbi:MAG: NAD(P)H-dependent oxidoreductase [Bacteroidia bacterium]|nr:NAD(P)H-dependent oxidoreductase [Bacteroidia bacterium]MBP9689495.1 NAD(P)H-dependent oxidoreductase [Bacteroidia bacterium]